MYDVIEIIQGDRALGYLIGYVGICPPLQEKSHYVAVAIRDCHM